MKFNQTVIDNLGMKKTSGKFGVEVEMEFTGPLHDSMSPKGWKTEADGSLRGFSAEFVLATPCGHKKVETQLDILEQYLAKNNVEVHETIRAGIHIHLNMQGELLGDFFKFLAVWYCLETFLVNSCGESRSGNLFCLRHRDAGNIHEVLIDALNLYRMHSMCTNNLRYSAMNFQSLFTYGSVEFRALRTTRNFKEDVLFWSLALENILKYSKSMLSVWDILGDVSGNGGRAFAEKVLGEEAVAKLYYPEMEDDIRRDVRESQMLLLKMKRAGL